VLGEWGLDWTTTDADRFGEDVVEMTDRMMAGWAYWSYDPGSWGFWDPATQTETSNIDHLVRPYPPRVAGTPLAFSWDKSSGVFELRWRGARDVTAPTEVYLPARLFPEGYDVDLGDDVDSATQSVDSMREVLRITLPAGRSEHLLRVTRRGAAGV